MSWLDENKDRGRHPSKDAKTDLLDFLRLQYGKQGNSRILDTTKIMGRDLWAGNDITPHMLIPEAEYFTLPNGQPAIRYKPPKRYMFGIDLATPMLDPTKAFIPGIENSRPSEDPEIRIKVRKHKLKFNFNN